MSVPLRSTRMSVLDVRQKEMIIATQISVHTGEGILIMAVAAPLVAFYLLRTRRRLQRIGIALTAHALALALVVEFGVSRRDGTVYHLIEELRFSRPAMSEGIHEAILFYAIAAVFLVVPALCASLIILLPEQSRRYLHWIALIVFCGFLGIGLIEALSGEVSTFNLLIMTGFGTLWVLMRFSPGEGRAEPIDAENGWKPLDDERTP